MGDFAYQMSLSTALASRDALCYTPPPFWQENFPSGTDNGRVFRFRAQFRFGCDGKKTGNLERSPNDSRARYRRDGRVEIRAENGGFDQEKVRSDCRSILPDLIPTTSQLEYSRFSNSSLLHPWIAAFQKRCLKAWFSHTHQDNTERLRDP